MKMRVLMGIAIAGLVGCKDQVATIIQQQAQELKHVDPEARKNAALTLGRYGIRSLPIAARLVDSTRDENERVRAAAVEALGKIGPDVAPLAGGAILQSRTDVSGEVRAAAATALSLIAPKAPTTEPSLVQGLSDIDAQVRVAALEALDRLESSECDLEAIRKRDPDPKVREAAKRIADRRGSAK